MSVVTSGSGKGLVTGIAAGDAGISGYGVWMEPSHTGVRDKDEQNKFSSKTRAVQFGNDVIFNNKTILGAVFGVDDTDTTLETTRGTTDSRGYSVLVYATHVLTDVFTVDGFAGYGENKQKRSEALRCFW